MKNKIRWNKNKALEIATKYNSRSIFAKNAAGAYGYLLRHCREGLNTIFPLQVKGHKFINNIAHKCCCKCKNWLELDNFSCDTSRWDGVIHACKECNRQYYEDNKDEFHKRSKIYRNKPTQKKTKKAYDEAYHQTADGRSRRNARVKKRMQTDPVFNFNKKIRGALTSILKRKAKTTKYEYIFGIPASDIKAYLTKTFEDRYGRKISEHDKIDLDHKVPTSTATTVDDIIKLNHYTNLQYLLRADNVKKWTSLDEF